MTAGLGLSAITENLETDDKARALEPRLHIALGTKAGSHLESLKKIDKGNGTGYMETIEQQAKLTEKHEMIIKQQTTPAKDLVES